MSLIRAEQIGKRFRSGRGEVIALDRVSLIVAKGDRVVLVGRSGSGKSTLLNCLGGLERPDCGRVVFDDREIQALGAREMARLQRRRVGFVFQSGNLLSFLTVRENLALPLELNGVPARQRRRRVDALLDRIGLAGAGAALPLELSGGEVQRVAVARAMAHAPDVLLADEPTASLDSQSAARLLLLMADLSRQLGTTLLIATHDPTATAMADRVLHMQDGRLEDAP